MINKPLLICLLMFKGFISFGQDGHFSGNQLPDFSKKTFDGIGEQAAGLQSRLMGHTDKYLKRIQRQEEKLLKKLTKKDSAAARSLQQELERTQYPLGFHSGLLEKAKDLPKVYSRKLDSIKTCLSFLDKTSGIGNTKPGSGDLQKAMEGLQSLQGTVNQAQAINNLIGRRQQLLQEGFKKIGLLSDLEKYKKEVFYYRRQLEAFKEVLEDPHKLESKALAMVTQTNAFKNFFANHSELAGLFVLPGATTPDAVGKSVPELQTRHSIQREIQQKYGKETKPQSLVSQQANSLQNPGNQLKQKLEQFSTGTFGNASNADMPDFVVNTNRTKTLWKRLEPGSNIQTTKGNLFFPVTSDIAVSLGYRITDKNVVGLGAAVKVGWGSDWKHMEVTAEGLNIRGYWDWKLKGNWWLSAGMELNYRDRIRNIQSLKTYTAWSESALAGITKKYRVRKKVQGNIQLLYDFLWKPQYGGQPLLFRIGYTLSQ